MERLNLQLFSDGIAVAIDKDLQALWRFSYILVTELFRCVVQIARFLTHLFKSTIAISVYCCTGRHKRIIHFLAQNKMIITLPAINVCLNFHSVAKFECRH